MHTIQHTNSPIVVTVGCFDVLHIGHVRLLKYAANLGDLIVGINSDASIKMIKGEARPINNQSVRKEFLLSFPFVKKVEIFNEPDALRFLQNIKPDIFIKGGDYTIETINNRETEYLSSIGSKIIIFPFVRGYSTSKILCKNH